MPRPVWVRLLTLVGVACVLGAATGVAIAALTREPDGGAMPVTVRVLGAVLRPASTESGRQRNRARLSVRVRVGNHGDRILVPERPVLLVPGHRVHTDPSADTPRTHIGQLAPGASAAVTLRFEVAGDVTTAVANEARARLVIAGQTRTTAVRLGTPVTPPAGAAPQTG